MTTVIELPVQSSRNDRGWGGFNTRSASGDPDVYLSSNESFVDEVLGKPKRVHYQSRDKLHRVSTRLPFESSSASLGIQAIHQAFAEHVPLSLRPDTLWYMIVHECAEHVRQNSDRYASLFTDDPSKKQLITVEDNSLSYEGPSDWMRSINLVREPLAAKISDEALDLFVPRFSTSTIEDETSMLVALMDLVSPYYEFLWMTRCGIPQIRLEGNAADWQSLFERTEVLARQFDGLSGYFGDLLPVLETIAQAANGEAPDSGFWSSIYKYEDGSGGARITGWITAFFAHELVEGADPVLKESFDWESLHRDRWGGFRANSFPSHYRMMPFIWDYYGTKIDMAFAAGVAGVDYEDGFLIPRLGFSVVEV